MNGTDTRIQAMMHVENTIELITDSLWEVSLSVRCKIEGLQKSRGKRWSSVATFYPFSSPSFPLFWRRLIITTTFLRPPFQCAPKCAISHQNAQLRTQKKLNECSTRRNDVSTSRMHPRSTFVAQQMLNCTSLPLEHHRTRTELGIIFQLTSLYPSKFAKIWVGKQLLIAWKAKVSNWRGIAQTLHIMTHVKQFMLSDENWSLIAW